jgi:hypothetical protein
MLWLDFLIVTNYFESIVVSAVTVISRGKNSNHAPESPV